MIGTQEQKFFTVKDVPAADFIKAYADFLKKNSKLERPVWADYIKTSKGILMIIKPRDLPLMMKISFISESPLWQEKYSSDQELELDF
jgi:hypothetical protein